MELPCVNPPSSVSCGTSHHSDVDVVSLFTRRLSSCCVALCAEESGHIVLTGGCCVILWSIIDVFVADV